MCVCARARVCECVDVCESVSVRAPVTSQDLPLHVLFQRLFRPVTTIIISRQMEGGSQISRQCFADDSFRTLLAAQQSILCDTVKKTNGSLDQSGMCVKRALYNVERAL